MIIRVFRARVFPDKHAEYERFIREQMVPLMQAEPGLLGFEVGSPMEPSPNEYLVVSTWRDMSSMMRFTGEKWQEPVALDGEADLVEEATVSHYEQLPIAES